MNNTTQISDVPMKRILKWHKLGQLISACIYLTVIPFLIIFILHGTQPNFEWCHACMSGLMYASVGFFVGRIACALEVKYNVWQWENEHNKKMDDKKLIQLM